MRKLAAVLCVLLLILSLPGTALAVTDTTSVTGDIAESISLDAPTSINLGALTVNGNTESSPQTITVYANNSDKTVSLTVRDNNQASNIGKMISGSNVLTDPVNVKGGDQASYVALPTSAGNTVTLESAGTVASGQFQITDFTVRQYVYWADKNASGYSITLYFEAAYTS
ncbi:MAG: hypothetical protein AB1374_11340 [Bacillota bacterium]